MDITKKIRCMNEKWIYLRCEYIYSNLIMTPYSCVDVYCVQVQFKTDVSKNIVDILAFILPTGITYSFMNYIYNEVIFSHQTGKMK